MTRVLIYSHDTYGLGHLRRSLRIAAALLTTGAARHVLIASGSPQASSFTVAPGIDVLKMPAVTKDAEGGYRSRTLGLDLADTVRVRSEIVWSAVAGFRPDILLVDHAPIGMAGELLATLERLATLPRRPLVLLGMRDVVDQVSKVEADWVAGGVWETLSCSYDGVLVYGDAAVLTTAQELELRSRISAPVQHVGYVSPPGWERSAPPARRRPSIVVTAGGGGDGLPVMEAYTRFVERSRIAGHIRSVIVTGPFLDGDPVGGLVERLAATGKSVDLIRFSDRMETLLATADGAVTMAGYNTVVELLAYRLPAMLVPRRVPRAEQWLRATRVASVADVMPVAAEDVTVEHFERFAEYLLSRPERRELQLDLDGGRAAGGVLRRLLADREPAASTGRIAR
jgi:predicted glycosyltransferase